MSAASPVSRGVNVGRLAGRIWVGATLTLISFLCFTPQLYIVLPSAAPWDAEVVQILLPFNGLVALLYYSYYKTVATPPGSVPPGYTPERDGMEVKRLTGGPRYCRTCKEYKPPRAHHCRQCKTCVLKMDHHCPWVNNCIGHFNYGHFVRFLFYVDVTCSYHLWMITSRAFGALSRTGNDPSATQIVILILNYTLCIPTLIAVGCFSIFHFWSVGTNCTTIEGWEKDKVALLRRRGRIREYKYPYNLGVMRNFKSVLGDNILTWCWPKDAKGTGLRYTVGEGLDSTAQYDWPPHDEFSKRERLASRHQRQRLRKEPPFTYGTGLNPDLVPSSSTTKTASLRKRHPTHHQNSPYHPNHAAQSASSSSSSSYNDDDKVHSQKKHGAENLPSDNDDDDDQVPLGEIASRRSKIAVRVRRGSEGLEIKPRFVAPPPSSQAPWQHVGREDGEDDAEYSVDEEGDRVRRGPRYTVYERDPESDPESELSESTQFSDSSGDSLDELLEDNM